MIVVFVVVVFFICDKDNIHYTNATIMIHLILRIIANNYVTGESLSGRTEGI